MVDQPEITIKQIAKDEAALVKEFVEKAGSSVATFRYYSKRSFEVINNHRVTVIAYHLQEPAAYGHLDQDGTTCWLGIAVAENFRGRQLGTVIMNALLQYAETNQVGALSLTVDKDNLPAIRLYEKFGFQHVADLSDSVILMKKEGSNG